MTRPAPPSQSVYGADPYCRASLRLPTVGAVDFRASCFCHRRRVDMAYVCSVCLSVFCARMQSCATCGAEFTPEKGGGGGGGAAAAAQQGGAT